MKDHLIINEAVISLGFADSEKDIQSRYHSSSLFSLYRITVPGRSKEIAAKVMKSNLMAKTESEGLSALRNAGGDVPEPYGYYSSGSAAVLFMEFIETGRSSGNKSLVINLSHLYAKTFPEWGWQGDNFIGTKKQPNGFHKTFSDYFVQDRIEAQGKEAVDRRLISANLVSRMASVIRKRAEEWDLESTRPRLIHGDLWGGNVLYSSDGKSYLIDPSVSYGHPEQDLAMLDLFGGPLSHQDKLAVGKSFDMKENYQERISYWQIYPLLVHVNIFGSSYVSQLENAVRKYE
ncbi:MAG: fructosamine kinase family protein [Spirochaetia bacterium]|nr:fructosamine kinase family protein [Spirochaetia bacterium]